MPLIERTTPLVPGLRRRVVTRCAGCAPGHEVLKVPAVSVSDAARCAECLAPLRPGERFWAVFADDES